MEQEATSYDLTGDDMISWPLNMPHRVENKSFCVSVTTEFSTPESSMKNAVMFSNAVLRQKFGALQSIKEADLVSFRVDKTAPDYIQNITPFARNF